MIWETRAAQAGMYDQMAEIVEKQGVAALADLMAHTPIFPALFSLVKAQRDDNDDNKVGVSRKKDLL